MSFKEEEQELTIAPLASDKGDKKRIVIGSFRTNDIESRPPPLFRFRFSPRSRKELVSLCFKKKSGFTFAAKKMREQSSANFQWIFDLVGKFSKFQGRRRRGDSVRSGTR